ncbi:carbohydrate ABC transporter permease [Pontivivens ytuae]|uniref:sn-glycerol-3-phosphate transport system permease protein UgpE n=2 Tax=Pontivivens ytuae TaxID=2789856 RepID=A0A7S9QEL0_9RHOB|nr:carbohydrate ABC transporter permease [Pontivivens ytuae]
MAKKLLQHGVLCLLLVPVLAPFIWMVSTSLKPAEEIFGAPLRLIPQQLAAAENYGRALFDVPMLSFMLNGLIVVLGILVIQVTVALFAGYALAKLTFRGRDLFFGLVLLALCIPIQVPALPLYLVLAELRLLNTYFALILPFMFSAFAIFLFRQFFKGYPEEVLQAARLDGMTEFEIVLRLILPGARPAIAAFSVFSIVAHWNDLYWPLIAITSMERATPPLGMVLFRDSALSADYGALTAGAVIITVPLLVLFVLAQRQFVRGITMTGLK